MALFYSTDITDSRVTLTEDEHRHATKALRYKVGGEVRVVDGLGGVYNGHIIEIQRHKTIIEINDKTVWPSASRNIEVVVSPTKKLDRMEWMVEKCVEIGVQSIRFVETFHSERRHLKLDRLHRIMISAMKQSKNVYLPQMVDMVALSDYLAEEKPGYTKIFGYVPENGRKITDIALTDNIVYLVGPEGDFDPKEVDALISHGYQAVSLGDSVLRTETAAVVGLTLLRHR